MTPLIGYLIKTNFNEGKVMTFGIDIYSLVALNVAAWGFLYGLKLKAKPKDAGESVEAKINRELDKQKQGPNDNMDEMIALQRGVNMQRSELMSKLAEGAKNKSLKGAKLYMANVMGGGKALTVGIMRERGGLRETVGTTPCGSKFLFDEDGELICSQPKGKELSIWSQC